MQAWKYQPWVQEVVDKRLAKLAEVALPSIGFHVRGGDKLAEDKLLVCSNCRANAWHAECRLTLDHYSLSRLAQLAQGDWTSQKWQYEPCPRGIYTNYVQPCHSCVRRTRMASSRGCRLSGRR